METIFDDTMAKIGEIGRHIDDLKTRLANLEKFAMQYHMEIDVNSAEEGEFQVICKGCDELRWVGLHPVTDEIHSYCEECIERLNADVDQ